MLGNTLRIKNRDRWNRQKVRIGKDDPLRREKFLFCMQNGLRVRGFPDVEETPEGVLLPQISEITEPEPTAFDDGHYVLYERGWEEQRKILIESGVEQEKIHVDLWNLENRHLNYVISSRIPSSVLRISWEVLEYRYRKGKQLVMELNRNREERYILPCWWGKGDTILLGSLLRQLRNGEEKRKIVLLIRRGHEELTTLFPWIDGYRILNQDERISMTTYFDIFGEAECGNVTYVMRSFPWCGLGKNWSDLEESTTMASVFRKGLSLEENSPISMFPEEKMDVADTSIGRSPCVIVYIGCIQKSVCHFLPVMF